MKIKGPGFPGPLPPQPAPRPGPFPWPPGTRLDARVTAARDGTLTLSIGGRTVQVELRDLSPPLAEALREAAGGTGRPFAAGDLLQVRAGRRAGRPALELVEHIPAPARLAAPALREVLPRQGPLGPLLANLHALATSGPDRPSLPPPVRAAVERVLALLPRAPALRDPQVLARALARSGVFLEHGLQRLAEAAADRDMPPQAVTARRETVETDLRLALERLAAALRQAAGRPAPAAPPPSGAPRPLPGGHLPASPAPARQPPGAAPDRQAAGGAPRPPLTPGPRAMPTVRGLENTQAVLGELLRQTEQATARIRTHQLTMAQEVPRPSWLLELPVRQPDGIDVFGLRIERDEPGQAGGRSGHAWRVKLRFELDALGPVEAHITLAGGAVSVHFGTGDEATGELFRHHLDALHRRLAEAGLAVGRLSCRCGLAPPAPGGDGPLLDDHA